MHDVVPLNEFLRNPLSLSIINKLYKEISAENYDLVEELLRTALSARKVKFTSGMPGNPGMPNPY